MKDFHIFVWEVGKILGDASATACLAAGMSWQMEAGYLQGQENLTNQMECVC